MRFFGYHLMLDCAGCDHFSISTKSNIQNFAKELVDAIDMIAYGEPQIVHFGVDDKAGYTLVQLIETSNITAHFVDETDSLYLDVFSCKSFDQEIVVELVTKYFGAKSIKRNYLTRQA